jgi:Raf kinase inhibitor-like YbhB/YbcL family protein
MKPSDQTFRLTSTAFEEGQRIPTEYTADGRDESPPLKWNDPPVGTQSFALVCEDPDAPRGTFIHWIAFNLPAASRELSAGVSRTETIPNGTQQGTNSFGKPGYGGPSPPPGKPHRYFFKLYALDAMLLLRPGAKNEQLQQALQGHQLGEAQLMGIHGR